MPELISNEMLTARRDHRCMASDFVREDLINLVVYLSFTEKREVVKARRNGWMVKKGERYDSTADRYIYCQQCQGREYTANEALKEAGGE